MKIAAKRELLRLRRAECVHAGDLQRKPQPQRAKMAGQLGRQVGRRRPDVASRRTGGYSRASCAEGASSKWCSVADQHRARAVGQEQGLVRIERDTVGQLDAREPRPPSSHSVNRPP